MKHSLKQDTEDRQIDTIVLMESISSCEYFVLKNNETRPVLEDIGLIIKKGETWGISGRSAYEMKLLLEIMANIKPYNRGRCVLAERGMLRRKRYILRHVFYIGTSEMPYNNMNVLEFLMLAMKKRNGNIVELQHQLFEFIIGLGLGYLSLTLNKTLTREERAVVTLIAAAHSDSIMIVFNFPEYEFDEVLIDAIQKISVFIKERGKSLILCTKNSLLIEQACNHTAILAEGRIIYQGSVRDFCLSYDNIAVIIRDKNIELLMDKLVHLLPDHKLSVKDENLLISTINSDPNAPAYIYDKISEAGIYPEYMEINPKKVCNAIEELLIRYDIQKQLL
ncbi:MAG: hypothetical protein GX625_05950 [Clostridiaceae bacterium]|nr:hypothetical protein [Clostridiaceae bacterium]